MIYVVSYVPAQNRQDAQGQNLHQFSFGRVSAHPQGSPPALHLLARISGPGSSGALAGSGSPAAVLLAGTKFIPSRRCSDRNAGKNATPLKPSSYIGMDQSPN